MVLADYTEFTQFSLKRGEKDSSSRCEEDTHYVSFQWEFCPSDFTPYGRYTHTKDEEFNATFLCDDCIKKDEASALNGSKQPLGFDGITDVKVERRLKVLSFVGVGTTMPISFLTDVLFPYARDNVRKHLEETYNTHDTQDDIKLLRSHVQGDLQNGVANAVPVSSDEVGKQEGHIWRTGFEKNELKGVVFMMFLALFKNGILLEQEGNKKLCRNFRITWSS
ncbi:hypothetical protein L2E82_32027 [Cichorium intybus]|uniref:Uncharacterized protein n=1 Tax=Cichorium intybus TaxID=13427 RepID=A0ACB9BFP2_CICIN|nr:hypothetical protein L2E82_32027 [Cichorium intybus]